MTSRRLRWVLAIPVSILGAGPACGPSPVQLGVGTFVWNVTPGDLAVQQGSTATFHVRLDSKVNINAGVTLSLSGAIPPNSAATLNPTRLPSTTRDATVTFSPTSQTPEGSYTFTITATEDGQPPAQLACRLDVVSSTTAPDFTLEVDPAELVLGGTVPTIVFYVRPRNGFAGTVNVSVEIASAPPPPVVVVQPPTPSVLNFTMSGGQGGTFVIRRGTCRRSRHQSR